MTSIFCGGSHFKVELMPYCHVTTAKAIGRAASLTLSQPASPFRSGRRESPSPAMVQKDRVLIVGATGYFGSRLVRASLALGHPTFVLWRPENASDRGKCQAFMRLKMQGAHLLQGSFDDHSSLVSALKQVDVVVCTVAGHLILNQLKLIEAIKEAGTIKRFLPSEFGMDVDRMLHAIPPGDQPLADKRSVRRAIEDAGIPHTYVSANCFAGVFLAGLAQLATFMPPRDRVVIHGNGDKRCIWADEDDVATYAMMSVSDHRCVNKILYVRPPVNIMTQMEVVQVWEKLIGKQLDKTFLSPEEWLNPIQTAGVAPLEQVAVAHMYHIFYLGELYFEVEKPRGVTSDDLYPHHKYVTVEEYLKRFV